MNILTEVHDIYNHQSLNPLQVLNEIATSKKLLCTRACLESIFCLLPQKKSRQWLVLCAAKRIEERNIQAPFLLVLVPIAWFPRWPQQCSWALGGPGRRELEPTAPCRDTAWNWGLWIAIAEVTDKSCPEPENVLIGVLSRHFSTGFHYSKLLIIGEKRECNLRKNISPLLKNSDLACDDRGTWGLL